MMLREILAIPSIILNIRRSYKHQKQYMQDVFLKELQPFIEDNDGSLTDKDFYKITHYYGLAVPVIAEMYTALRGTPLTMIERRRLTYLGAISGVFDDFFDERETDLDHIRKLFMDPDVQYAQNTHESLFVHFYMKVLQTEDVSKRTALAARVYEAEIKSKKQEHPDISIDELLSITEEKGAVSLLFWRAALQEKIDPSEEALLRKIGLLSQIENDLFDIYEDTQDGISTYPNRIENLTVLSEFYEKLLDDVCSLVSATPYSDKNKLQFKRYVVLVASRGFVFLEQLKRLTHTDPFKISNYSRSELICDMATVRNNMKWVANYLRYNSK